MMTNREQDEAIALMNRALRVLACASVAMIRDGEATFNDLNEFLSRVDPKKPRGLTPRFSIDRKMHTRVEFNATDWSMAAEDCTSGHAEGVAKYLDSALETYLNCQCPRDVTYGAVALVMDRHVRGASNELAKVFLNCVLDFTFGKNT